MSNLISMADFVLNEETKLRNDFAYTNKEALVSIFDYANFLKQHLELWMFVPCGEDGEVLEEPNHLDYKSKNQFGELVFNSESNKMHYHSNYDIYQQAKDRVLFEGFEFHDNTIYNGFQRIQFLKFNNGNTQVYLVDYTIEEPFEIRIKTIEDLVKYNLTLTDTEIRYIN